MIQKAKELFYETFNLFKPVRCVICGQYILIGRYALDSWNQAAHDFHKISFCFSCGRIIVKNGLVLPDSRQLCEICQPSVVKTPLQIEWVDKRVRAILTSVSITDIPQDIQIEIVDPYQFMRIKGNNKIDLNQHGLAISKKITSKGVPKNEHKVYILDHLPKIAFAGVLAHELLHIWQNDKGINPPSDICEGFCDLGSYAVYSAINNQLALHFIEQLEKSDNPVYGEGYRKVKRYLDQNGWQALIAKIKN